MRCPERNARVVSQENVIGHHTRVSVIFFIYFFFFISFDFFQTSIDTHTPVERANVFIEQTLGADDNDLAKMLERAYKHRTVDR